MLLASGPCAGRAIYGTDTTSDTLIGIANDLSVHHGESSYRTTAAVLHALFAAYATGRIILGLGLTDNTEVIQACMRTVIGTTGAGNLYVVIIGEDHLIDFRCQFLGVIATEGTEFLTGACNDISGTGGRITLTGFLGFLCNTGIIDDGLQSLIYFLDILQRDAGNLKALTVGDINGSLAVLACNLYNLSQGLYVDLTAGNTDTGSSLTTHLGLTEGVLLKFLYIYI